VVAPLSGLFNGIMVEGVAAYSYDWILVKKRKRDELSLN